MKEIARGAEAVLYEYRDKIIKHRLKKAYRIKELDDELRKQRTRREAKLLKKLTIPHPALIDSDDKEEIIMQKIKGQYPKIITFRGKRYKFYRLFGVKSQALYMAKELRKDGARVSTRSYFDKDGDRVYLLYIRDK